MSEIEWQADQPMEPPAKRLESVCVTKGLPVTRLPKAGPVVLIATEALEALNHYLEADTSREHGGVLAGQPFYDPVRAQFYVDIQAAIPALETSGSPVHLQFTPQAWDHISGILEESFPQLVIVGWYHSHPGLGVFMSATDQASHRAFYSQPWNVALVVDPVIKQSGWFSGPESDALQSGQVLLYGDRLAAERRQTSRSIPDLSWLLPLALFGLAAALSGLWLIGRGRG